MWEEMIFPTGYLLFALVFNLEFVAPIHKGEILHRNQREWASVDRAEEVASLGPRSTRQQIGGAQKALAPLGLKSTGVSDPPLTLTPCTGGPPAPMPRMNCSCVHIVLPLTNGQDESHPCLCL
jgi:hypothetical protein